MASRLVDFINARLDEDEREARICLGRGGSGHRWYKVLAQVAAMRAVMEFHESWPVLVDTPPELSTATDDTGNMTVKMAKQVAWLTNQEYRKRFGTEPPTAPMLGHIAAIWSDHPDYLQEWSVLEHA